MRSIYKCEKKKNETEIYQWNWHKLWMLRSLKKKKKSMAKINDFSK